MNIIARQLQSCSPSEIQPEAEECLDLFLDFFFFCPCQISDAIKYSFLVILIHYFFLPE